MAKSYEIIWTVSSKEDLYNIYTQLSMQLTEEKAFEVLNRIMHRVEILASMPLIGQKEPLLAKLKGDYRRIIEGHYKIIYNFNSDTVYINRVFDSRQNPKKLSIKS